MLPKVYSLHSYAARFIIALTLAFLCSYTGFAQALPVKWGKISADELKFKVCPYDSSATAVVLCDYGEVSFNYGSYVTINRHIRIKILDRKAIDRANVVLPYYVANELEKITDIKAQTINVNAQGKTIMHEVASSQVFDVKADEKWYQKRFSLPSVSEGSIIEYKYTTLSKNVTFLEGWVFQNDIPTLHSEFRAKIGQDLDYRILYQGSRLMKAYGEKATNQWTLKNLPALRDEPFTAHYMDYAEKIRFQLAGYYKQKDGIGGGIEYVTTMTTWEKLSKEIMNDNAYTTYLNRRGVAEKMLEKINLPADESKMQKIYDYVKNTIRWNGKYRIFPEKSLTNLIEIKEGNSSEINLLLTLLLTEAGVKANPVLISTRGNGKAQQTYPLLSQFNHVIVHVQAGDKSYLLDATDPFRSYRLLDKEDLNTAGFLMDEEKPRWIEIKPNNETRQVVSITADLTGVPSYKIDIIYKGYMAVEQRKSYVLLSKEEYIKKQMPAGFTDFKLTSFSTTSAEDSDQDFTTTFVYTSEETSNPDTRMLYIQPVLFHTFTENPFKPADRLLPIEYDYPSGFNYILNLKIPAGYQVQELPKPVSVRLPESMGDFKYVIQQNGNQIQLSSSVHTKAFLLPSEYYPYLKEFYNQITAKYNEFIVLQKQ